MRETPGKIACDANGRIFKNPGSALALVQAHPPGKKFDGLDS
jgi:hypothetical protein